MALAARLGGRHRADYGHRLDLAGNGAKAVTLDGRAVLVVAKLAPWFAPLPTAWLVYERTQRHLSWPAPVAAIAGLVLELLGVAVLATALELWAYNREKRKSDPAAVMWIPGALVVLYFVAAELLTVALDVWPSLALYAPAVFPVLSVAAFVLLGLRAEHDQRLADIEQDKADAKAERDRRKREQEQKKKEPKPLHPFQCSICGAWFDTQAALNGHGNAHSSRRAKPSTGLEEAHR